MKSSKRWTIEEEQVLIAQIKKNPGNLTKAFDLAATKLDRTVKAIKMHYYLVIVTGKSKVDTSCVFMTISENKAIANRKNAKDINYIEIKPSLWKQLIKYIGKLFHK